MQQPPTDHVDEVIESVAEIERRAHHEISDHQRRIEKVTRRLGRPSVVYLVIGVCLLWAGVNLVLHAVGATPFDPPPFPLLDSLMTFLELVLVVLILTTEHRSEQLGLRRSQLDLQMNLLNERRMAKLIEMVDALRRDLPQIPTHNDPEVEQLRSPTDPHDALRAIQERTPPNPGTI
jgi:uncharacterized membrane protein